MTIRPWTPGRGREAASASTASRLLRRQPAPRLDRHLLRSRAATCRRSRRRPGARPARRAKSKARRGERRRGRAARGRRPRAGRTCRRSEGGARRPERRAWPGTSDSSLDRIHRSPIGVRTGVSSPRGHRTPLDRWHRRCPPNRRTVRARSGRRHAGIDARARRAHRSGRPPAAGTAQIVGARAPSQRIRKRAGRRCVPDRVADPDALHQLAVRHPPTVEERLPSDRRSRPLCADWVQARRAGPA